MLEVCLVWMSQHKETKRSSKPCKPSHVVYTLCIYVTTLLKWCNAFSNPKHHFVEVKIERPRTERCDSCCIWTHLQPPAVRPSCSVTFDHWTRQAGSCVVLHRAGRFCFSHFSRIFGFSFTTTHTELHCWFYILADTEQTHSGWFMWDTCFYFCQTWGQFLIVWSLSSKE